MIRDKLLTLQQVGLGYIHIGQQATTLSGGEAQRVKLAKELSRRATGRTLYILDEPTTGLHFEDVRKLLEVLHRLVEGGNTVVVIEHNLEVIKTADWVLDLGPDGGAGGGRLVAEGPPEEIVKVADSYTGQYLARHLPRSAAAKKRGLNQLLGKRRAASGQHQVSGASSTGSSGLPAGPTRHHLLAVPHALDELAEERRESRAAPVRQTMFGISVRRRRWPSRRQPAERQCAQIASNHGYFINLGRRRHGDCAISRSLPSRRRAAVRWRRTFPRQRACRH